MFLVKYIIKEICLIYRLADFKEKPLAAGDQIQRRIEFLQRQKQ